MTSITITRHSERGRPIAAPVAQTLTLEDELEAEMIAFEIDLRLAQRRTEDFLQRSATVQFATGALAFLNAALATLAFLWLAARLGTGV